MSDPPRSENDAIVVESSKHNAAEILRNLAVQERSVSALLWLGRVEVGRVDLSNGEVIHAEIPGAVGDAALRLLPRLLGIRITLDDLRGDRRTVGPQWRKLLGVESPADAKPTPRGAPAPAALEGRVAADSPSRAQADFDELFGDAMTAYLRRDYELAQELFEACEEILPGDRRVAHNLQRLKARGNR